MFTVCSKCNLRLTVTPTDLRTAQGYVRCGRCHNVFNALAALSEETPETTGVHRANTATPAPQPASTASTASTAPVAAAGPQPAPATTPGPLPAAVLQAVTAPAPEGADTDLEFNASATDVSSIFVTPPTTQNTGTFESIILRGSLPEDDRDDINVMHLPTMELAALAAVAEEAVRQQARQEQELAGEDPLEPASAEPAPQDTSTQPALTALQEPFVLPESANPLAAEAETRFELDPQAAAPEGLNAPAPEALEPGAVREPAAAAVDADAADAAIHADIAAAAAAIDADPLTATVPAAQLSPLPAWLPAAACAILALGLVAQAVHHWRDSLATGPLRRPLTALYAGLGLPLSPHWDVSRYEVRQLGAQAAESGGNLEIHAAIRNKARRAQPLPLLRVTLEDQFGNRVAARDLTPAEYLPHAAADATLAPDAHVDASAAFVDPGQAAVGFELDACLRLRTGLVVCANDPGRPAP